MNIKSEFANSLFVVGDLGNMATDCEKYGMTWGCDSDCPVLNAGECENWRSLEEYFNEIDIVGSS